jgi:transposase
MSIEYTAINKETAEGEVKNFLESCSDDTVFKMVINSKRGYLRIKIKNPSKNRIKRIISKLKRKRSNLYE